MSEEIEIIPEQVLVKRHIYPRYACRVCEGSGNEDKPVFRISRQDGPKNQAGAGEIDGYEVMDMTRFRART